MEAFNQERIEIALPAGEDEFELMIRQLSALQSELRQVWTKIEPKFSGYNEYARASAQNLVHYLVLRRHDVRELQTNLARNGISSLGRSESHVMSNIRKVNKLLHRIVQRKYISLAEKEKPLDFDEGKQILKYRTDALLGDEPENRKVRIMVTLPSGAAENYHLVRDLIAGGMNCARINCAHDGKRKWAKMVRHIRRAESELKKSCKICFDIAGPKLRTGQIEEGIRMIKLKPARDFCGRVIKPVNIWITSVENPEPAPFQQEAKLKFSEEFLEQLTAGEKIKFRDARQASRSLIVKEIQGKSCWAEGFQTAYITPETKFKISRQKHGDVKFRTRAFDIPPHEQSILLQKGDRLILTKAQIPGKPAKINELGEILETARIPCTLSEVFEDVKVGEAIWLDDGKIAGVISAVRAEEIEVEVTQAGVRGIKLKADKGINLPDSELRLPALTAKDLKDLKFVVKNADILGYSFVCSGSNVVELQKKLSELDASRLGIILKIETRRAFEHLPEILLTAMNSPAVGVMIARGDLAVEAGFERMSEVQEEILWMCEAAHLPVIWATQVLEQLSKTGVYSRAEITDAAMSERAECVMLNKGEFVIDAVRVLDDILTRMEGHQDKKRAMLRHLSLADKFFDDLENLQNNKLDPEIVK